MRFVPRPVDRAWRVFDTVTWSYPYARAGLGIILQDASKEEIQTECDRLNAL